MKSSWKRPFHLPTWEQRILFWRSVSAARASRNGDPAVGCWNDTHNRVSRGEWEELSHENGKSWWPCCNTEKGHVMDVQIQVKRWSFLPHRKSSKGLAKGQNHWRVRVRVFLEGTQCWRVSCAALLGVSWDCLHLLLKKKKREKLPHWRNERQKRNIWFYATADVS